MMRRHRPWLPALTIAALLWGCADGSGSSGFDISPAAENALIRSALEMGECVDSDTLTVCPSLDHFPTTPPGLPSPDPEVSLQVETLFNGAEDIVDAGATCHVNTRNSACILSPEVVVIGLPAGTVYQLAARSPDLDSAWVIDGRALSVQMDDTLTRIHLSVEIPGNSPTAQVAVLVFLDDHDGVAPGTVQTLSETGATLVFVTTEVPVQR